MTHYLGEGASFALKFEKDVKDISLLTKAPPVPAMEGSCGFLVEATRELAQQTKELQQATLTCAPFSQLLARFGELHRQVELENMEVEAAFAQHGYVPEPEEEERVVPMSISSPPVQRKTILQENTPLHAVRMEEEEDDMRTPTLEDVGHISAAALAVIAREQASPMKLGTPAKDDLVASATSSRGGNLMPLMEDVTDEELSKLPEYLKAQVTLVDVNTCVSCLNDLLTDRRFEDGEDSFVERDVIVICERLLGKKGPSSEGLGRAVLMTLKALRRIEGIRGGGYRIR